MAVQPGTASDHVAPDVLAALAHHRRRKTLALIDRLDDPAIEDLAAALADAETDTPAQDELTGTSRIRLTLEHVHIPHLADRDLVVVEDGTVTTTDHPALEDPFVRTLIESATGEWDDVLGVLADVERCLVLTAVRDADTPVERSTLAATVADRLAEDGEAARPVGTVDEALHHLHLPALDAAGLVSYDPDSATVTYEGHPTLSDALPAVDAGSTRRSFLTMAR